ncbi:MAG: LPS assembly protein LptD [Cycloclasticus sp.]
MVKQLAVNPWQTCDVTTEALRASREDIRQSRLNASVDIQADYSELTGRNDAKFTGDVSVTRADQLITADQVSFQNKEGIASASGDVFYQEKGFALHSDQAQLQLKQDTGQFSNNQFILENTHARGTTQTTNLINRDITQSTNISYTTCAPNDTDWQLRAKTLELNNLTGRGTARNVWVEVFDTPVLYTPYISFPIDDRRQSGVLTPTFGHSDTTGVDISVPYYWNIGPNYDATLTPRVMTDRGLMLGGEFRYLTNNSEGQVAAEILDDTDKNDLRGQFSLQNTTIFNSRLSANIDLNYQSDDDYLEDFGNNLSIASDRYLISNADLTYQADDWNLLARVDNYELIDNRLTNPEKPYRRLPQVLFNLHEMNAFGIAKVDMRNEFVHFDRSDDTTAQRIDLHPGISIPFRTASSFVTPRLSLRHTDYRLSNQSMGVDRDQSRTLPILSVDSGLFFERDLELAGGMIQTLEPRAYYLYVPHENQDEFPLFDTSTYDFSFNQLFRENRFSGADRVADANQLTLAVTSRFIEPDSGNERLRASVGTVVYFDDLDVGLTPSSAPITKDTSDLIAEVSAKINNNWSARSALQYDPHAGKTQKSTLGIHYRDTDERIFNATYRSRLEAESSIDDIEQTDLSFKWPLSKTWSTVGRWNYSLQQNLSLESFIGLEKDTCCWRFRVIARRYVNDAFDEKPKEGLFFQFELKGLTSFGKKLDSFLEEGVLGYQVPEQ